LLQAARFGKKPKGEGETQPRGEGGVQGETKEKVGSPLGAYARRVGGGKEGGSASPALGGERGQYKIQTGIKEGLATANVGFQQERKNGGEGFIREGGSPIRL